MLVVAGYIRPPPRDRHSLPIGTHQDFTQEVASNDAGGAYDEGFLLQPVLLTEILESGIRSIGTKSVEHTLTIMPLVNRLRPS
jgi:hypothetical protein